MPRLISVTCHWLYPRKMKFFIYIISPNPIPFSLELNPTAPPKSQEVRNFRSGSVNRPFSFVSDGRFVSPLHSFRARQAQAQFGKVEDPHRSGVWGYFPRGPKISKTFFSFPIHELQSCGGSLMIIKLFAYPLPRMIWLRNVGGCTFLGRQTHYGIHGLELWQICYSADSIFGRAKSLAFKNSRES